VSTTATLAPQQQLTQQLPANTDKSTPNTGITHKKPYTADHLKKWHWKPGQSGNPHGRPKKTVQLLEALKDELAKRPPGSRTTNTVLVARALVEKAKKGHMGAQQLLWERVLGKVPDNLTVDGQMHYTELEMQVVLNATKGHPEDGRAIASALRQLIADRSGA